MSLFRRFKIEQISVKRLFSGFANRLFEIPHFLSWYFQPFAYENRERIRKFKNCHFGERCFIIANGPSLSKMNLEYLSNEISFGLNRIYLNFENSTFRPTYFVAVNDLVIKQFHKDISGLEMPRFLSWNNRSVFDPKDQNNIFLKSKLVLQDHFEKNLTHSLVFGGTVTFVTLQVAFYMGFQEVILIGLDHNYVEKGTPNKQETRNEDQDENHFHPNYFPKGSKWQLPDIFRSEVDYKIALDVYEREGRKIVDATQDGKCTVFPKKTYELFFPNLKKK